MSRPKRYVHHLTAAKEEALFACDLYNQHRQARSLEAFLVHMGIAWCNLFRQYADGTGSTTSTDSGTAGTSST